MFKRMALILLALILTASISACSTGAASGGDKGDIVSPENKGQEKEINVLVYKYMYEGMELYNPLLSYAQVFQRELGVKVNFIPFGNPKYVEVKGDKYNGKIIDESWRDDFFKELNVKLVTNEGPELILVADDIPTASLISQGAVIDVKGRLSNFEKIYPGVTGENTCYIPVGMRYNSINLNGKVLEELNIEKPPLNWSRADYMKIRDKWLEKEPIRFYTYEYHDIIYNGIENLDIYDSTLNRVNLNTPQVVEGINSIRNEVFSGKYILDRNYDYSNYCNMFFDVTSEEFSDNWEINTKASYSENHIRVGHSTNGFNAAEASNWMKNNGEVILPAYERGRQLQTWGFVVNHNGKNTELALEFVNGLLSDEIQLNMFKDSNAYYYPVNSDIEGEIIKLEAQNQPDKYAVEMKDYVLSLIKSQDSAIYNPSAGIIYEKIFKMIREDLFKFIFAHTPYGDEELKEELRILENKCNIYLNE